MKAAGGATVQETFLDAYTPGKFELFYGAQADYADHYYTDEGLYLPETQDALRNAYNANITAIDAGRLPNFDEVDLGLGTIKTPNKANISRNHAYPYNW